jgi:hypothetical protein
MGEEAYLLKQVISPSGPGEYGPNNHLLHLIAVRYPQHLPRLYEATIRKWPRAPNHLLAELLGKSRVPQDVKVRLFLMAARSQDLQQRMIGLRQLFELHHPEAVPLLIESFQRLPKTPKEPYWLSKAGSVGLMATLTDDMRVWLALEATARRVDVGQRMEILNVMNYTKIEGRQRQQRIDLLRKFLDDRTVRDVNTNPAAFSGPCAGFGCDRLAVRDLAAEKLAAPLGIPLELDPAWTKREWAALRQRVQDALAQH